MPKAPNKEKILHVHETKPEEKKFVRKTKKKDDKSQARKQYEEQRRGKALAKAQDKIVRKYEELDEPEPILIETDVQVQRRYNYPFKDMNVGDSFFTKNYRAQSAAHTYGFNNGKKFSSQYDYEKEGWRIWRIL